MERLSRDEGATETLTLDAKSGGDDVDLVLIHSPNRHVGQLIGQLSELEELHISMFPSGVLHLQPPAGEEPGQVTDVSLLSPLEVFLGGLQSVGSWRGFLGYAAAGGMLAWIGLFTNSVFLLIAAMLIAPFAGPAMNAAIATARGDLHLLGRSIGRYFAAIAVAMGVSALTSYIFGQRIATQQMVETSTISTVAVVLPLVAGFAGALNLVQSERSSLVSGAATGLLVAAALAPPTALVGMAAVIGDWSMAKSGLFLLGLQLVGINLSGAATFRFAGLGPEGTRYRRGQGWVQKASLLTTVAALAVLLTWQFANAPELQRATLSQRAAATVQQVVNESGRVRLVQVNAEFTRADIPDQNTLLVVLYVQKAAGIEAAPAELQRLLARQVRQELLRQHPFATPVIDITVLEPPASQAARDGEFSLAGIR